MKGATEAAPDAAYVRGDRLRTHILRPTWHSVLPEEIRWILALIAPHIRRADRGAEWRARRGAELRALLVQAGGRHGRCAGTRVDVRMKMR